jgi:predicted rRNA methylase YqxC with S4 and FtsJ domains
VVRDAAVHERVVSDVQGGLETLGVAVIGSVESALIGPAGNKEFLVAFKME